MQDHFAKLGVPRAPWIEPEELKQKFLALSAQLHPDKAIGKEKAAEAEFQAINQAYTTLRSTRSRVLHLLELEGISRRAHVEALPPAAVDLFSTIAEVTRKTDLLLKEKSAAVSPMLKAKFLQQAVSGVDEVQRVQSEIQQRISVLEAEIRDLNHAWRSALRRLQEIVSALGFFERWNAQLLERSAALTF